MEESPAPKTYKYLTAIYQIVKIISKKMSKKIKMNLWTSRIMGRLSKHSCWTNIVATALPKIKCWRRRQNQPGLNNSPRSSLSMRSCQHRRSNKLQLPLLSWTTAACSRLTTPTFLKECPRQIDHLRNPSQSVNSNYTRHQEPSEIMDQPKVRVKVILWIIKDIWGTPAAAASRTRYNLN